MKFKIACTDHKSDPDQHHLGGSCQKKLKFSVLKTSNYMALDLQIHKEAKSPKKPNWGGLAVSCAVPSIGLAV